MLNNPTTSSTPTNLILSSTVVVHEVGTSSCQSWNLSKHMPHCTRIVGNVGGEKPCGMPDLSYVHKILRHLFQTSHGYRRQSVRLGRHNNNVVRTSRDVSGTPTSDGRCSLDICLSSQYQNRTILIFSILVLRRTVS